VDQPDADQQQLSTLGPRERRVGKSEIRNLKPETYFPLVPRHFVLCELGVNQLTADSSLLTADELFPAHR
jgi:hypothetical protein